MRKLKGRSIVRLGLFAPLAGLALLMVRDASHGDSPLSIRAGDDQSVLANEPVKLDGSKSRLSHLEFLIADGDGPLEDQLVTYHSEKGVSARSLRDALNKPLGWPGGMAWARDSLVGIDVSERRLVLIVPESSNFRYLTRPLSDKPAMTAITYDERNDRLLVFDIQERELSAVDPQSGEASTLARLNQLEGVTGLAYASPGKLLAYDQKTRGLYAIQPDTGAMELASSLQIPDDAICDDLCMFGGELYCTVCRVVDGIGNVQVCRVDLKTGGLTQVGPVINDAMGHALVMKSVPEKTEWQLVDGPTAVQITSSQSLVAEVTLQKPGDYTFRLSVSGSPNLADTVWITVRERREP